jgi:outer membrane protein OmpA-like peptidoglycan-associated protein/tetratricopeptide (TPR) repeat protein
MNTFYPKLTYQLFLAGSLWMGNSILFAQNIDMQSNKPSSSKVSTKTIDINSLPNTKSAVKKITKEADELYIDEMYASALPIYLKLDVLKPENAEINYKIAICYLHSNTKGKAAPYLLKAQQYDKKHEFEDINYYLGVAYHYGLEFDKAIETYEKYKLLLKPNLEYTKDVTRIVNKYIANCHNAKELVKNPIKVDLQNLGMKVNTSSEEGYPVITPDDKTLFFMSKRIDLSGLKPGEEPEDVFEDIYVSVKTDGIWSQAKKVGKGLNTFKHDAPLSVSADGKKLFFYRTDKNNSTDIYYIEYKDTSWTSPKPFTRANSPSWERGACISPDGKTFYFSSDRPGGYGGMDLYYCKYTEKGWGFPKNMGPILNSEWDEEAPQIMPDGKTLYFSNNGPKSIGGLDIFKTTLKDSLWSIPQNIGFPINTPEHEIHISITADGKKGYFASNKSDSYGEDDIYEIDFPEISLPEAKYEAPKDTVIQAVKYVIPKENQTFTHKVFFDFNIAANYTEASHPAMQEMVDAMNKYPNLKIEIGGHADNQGNPDVNQIISEKRAQSVYKYLISEGIAGNRMLVKGYSNHHLVIAGTSTVENAPNRRVEFKVLPEAAFAPAVKK